MPGSKTNYLEEKLLDHVFGLASYTAPTTVYLALFTSAPGESGGGTEVSAADYARKALTNNNTTWERSGSTVTNTSEIQFPECQNNWGTVVATALFDASTGGNMLYYSTIASEDQRDFKAGDIVRFKQGTIQFTED